MLFSFVVKPFFDSKCYGETGQYIKRDKTCNKGGSVTVDGKVANKWGTSISGLPMPLKFEIQGKKAEIKSEGFMANIPALYLD